MRVLGFVYGLAAYAAFLGTFSYLVGFVAGLVPRSIDGPVPAAGADPLGWWVNLALLALFAVQHSVMARRGFKRRWTRLVPAGLERSTFVLATCVCLWLLFWQWRPMPAVVWHLESMVGRTLAIGFGVLGWLLVLVSTFLIDHLELFGLDQAWRTLRGEAPARPEFRQPGFYRWVRHPLYLGITIAAWATPTMTAGHLLFAAVITGYVLLGIRLEERELVREFGEVYREYRRRTRMLLPLPKRVAGASSPERRPLSTLRDGRQVLS